MLVSGGICSLSKEAEVRAVFFALNIVRELELDNIIFLTDSLEVERRSDSKECCGGYSGSNKEICLHQGLTFF